MQEAKSVKGELEQSHESNKRELESLQKELHLAEEKNSQQEKKHQEQLVTVIPIVTFYWFN